jgi:3-methyladenine DNA glycosylase AlkD
METSYVHIQKEFQLLASPKQARVLQRFFKTGSGEYAEGDIFLGIRMPIIRAYLRAHTPLSDSTIQRLLHSPIHEERMLGVLALVDGYVRATTKNEKNGYIAKYLSLLPYINNWDLVDVSAPYILGNYAVQSSSMQQKLIRLAHSSSLWERRIAIVATYGCIRAGDDSLTYRIAALLLADEQDLIHKAVGWMLREAGKRVDVLREKKFLSDHAYHMPRTMLRYAIELFPEHERKNFLLVKVKK